MLKRIYQLRDDWKLWWKFHSTYVWAMFVAFPIAWKESTLLQQLLPPQVVSVIAPCAAFIGFIVTMRKQTFINKEDS
jgi:hypothetical protein